MRLEGQGIGPQTASQHGDARFGSRIRLVLWAWIDYSRQNASA
jgi:hypothetical protein